MYGDFIDSVGVIIYVMRADARDHTIDEEAYSTIFNTTKNRSKVIIALNQCDKVKPITRGKWQEPTKDQMKNIQNKINFIQKKFSPQSKIIPYSAATGWNMDALAKEMVNTSIQFGDILLNNTDYLMMSINELRARLD